MCVHSTDTGERVQFFIQAKAFRDQGGSRDTEGLVGRLGVGGWFSETRGDGVQTDRGGAKVYTEM